MIVRVFRRLPAIVLILLLAILTLVTWSDLDPPTVRVSGRVDGLAGITWSARVSTAGRLAVRITYDLGDDTPRTLSVRLPDGARYFQVDGTPTPASNGVYATVPVATTVTISYELPGAVTRYRDGALLNLARVVNGSLDGDSGMFPCVRCYLEPSGYGDVPVFGAIAVSNADQVRLSFVHLSAIRSDAATDEVRFAGIDRTGDDLELLATLPADAVPGLPMRDGSVAQALEAARAPVLAVGQSFSAPTVPEHRSRPAVIVMTALLAAMLVWFVVRTLWAVGARAAERAARASDDPSGVDPVRAVRPSQLEPALVGAVIGNSITGERSVVAATILELARRKVVAFSGNDRRRFTLTVPAGASGSTRFEQAVIDCLRAPPATTSPSGIEAVERVGPPLWPDGTDAARTLQRTLVREALRTKLVRISPPAVLLVPATLAIGVLGIIGSRGGSVFAWIVTVIGTLLALSIAIAAGLVLTPSGRAERDQWLRYAMWLRTDRANAHLADAEPWDVATTGEVLSYATALGAAPHVVRILSPRPGASR